jgi:3-hydroxyisobutyrate dehydrogenase
MADEEQIAVLGAGGTMGFAIARNLAAAGFQVRAWNRSKEKAEPLAEHENATVFESAAAAASGADVILTMLTDAGAVEAAIAAALTGELDAHQIWLQMSTIGEAGTQRCIELAREHAITLVDAPVLGTKQPAEQGELVILASGPEHARPRLEGVFDTIGRRSMWVGEAGAGTRLKIATNSWIVSVAEGAAETLALAEGMGLEPQLVLDAIEGGPLDMPYMRIKAKAMLEHDFEPSFKLALAAKDAALAEESARRHGLELPLLSTISARLEQGAREHGEEDLAATYLTSEPAGAAR